MFEIWWPFGSKLDPVWGRRKVYDSITPGKGLSHTGASLVPILAVSGGVGSWDNSKVPYWHRTWSLRNLDMGLTQAENQ